MRAQAKIKRRDRDAGARRGAPDRFVFAFDSLTSSTDLRRQIDRSRRCGQHNATHGYLFKQLIYNRRKYAATPAGIAARCAEMRITTRPCSSPPLSTVCVRGRA